MLDPEFTDQILEAWKNDEEHLHRGRIARVLPPRHAIKKFVDTTFLATLRNEEGHPTRFSVALVLEEDLSSSNGHTMVGPIPLESSLEFSAASLVKLAGAFDPELTTIIVQWNLSENSFSYWGLTFHSSALNRFTQFRVAVEGSPHLRSDYFTVIAKGRAALTIARGRRSQIGTLQAGYFVAASPTPFTSHSLGQYIHLAIQNDPLFTVYGNQYWYYARDAMEFILAEASSLGHGGTIVLLPSDLQASSELYTSKYIVTKSFGLHQTLGLCIENEENIKLSFAHCKIANETIKRIAHLSAIDGALIITFDFEILSFGATLTAPRSTSSLVVGPDGFGQTQSKDFEINRYGTRHRSAFDFASATPGSVVFVISQDGPVRAFRRKDDTTVHVWPDCTVSMFG